MIRDKYLANKLFEFNGYRGSLQDQTGNGTLTVASAPYWGRKNGRCINFDGINDSLSYGNISNLGSGDWTFDMVISFPVLGNQEYLISKYQNADNRWYIRKNIGGELFMFSKVGGTTVISATSNANFTEASKEYKVTVVGDRTNGLKFYVNGVDETGTITTFDAANLDNTGALAMAKWDVSFGESCNGYTEIYNTAFTPQDVAESFEEWQLSQPYNIVDFRSIEASTGMADGVVPAYIADGKGWNENLDTAAATGFIDQTGWTRIAGITNVKTNDDGFTKYLESGNSFSVTSAPSNQVYGTWEFDVTSASGNASLYQFINNQQDARFNGYYISFDANGTVKLIETTGGSGTVVMTTAAGYHSKDTKYRVKITRATNGSFTCYLDDVLWTVTGTNPATDNTWTTCSYMVSYFKSLDRLENFKFIPYIN
jgi:hypothetical protein